MPGARPPAQAAPLPVNSQADELREDVLDLEKKTIAKPSVKESSHVASVLFYCGLNAILSASLIAFNKHLMHRHRFPYPVPLVAIHTTISAVFVGMFLLLHRGCSNGVASPGFFSALPQALADTTIKSKVVLLAGLFVVQLVFSNAAYLYSSVVFIQMMKEGNIALVYFLSVIAALEIVHWQRVRVLLVIGFATLITIKGEVNFTWIGFSIQLTGQCFEGVRIVLQALMLHGKGLNLDVLTYMLFVMPASATILFASLGFNSYVWEVHSIALPTLAILIDWWPVLLANALLALCLNFSTALVVKHASAVGLVLSGLMKDSAIVICGAYFLKEHISSLQVLGFVIQMSGVLSYSMIKLYPEKFADGILPGFKRIVTREADALPPPATGKDQFHHYGAAQDKTGFYDVNWPASDGHHSS